MSLPLFRYTVWGVALIGCVLLGVSIPNHDFYVDEAFIGEYAYFFARDGYVHSAFWEGFLRQDEYVVLHHHLATWSGAAMIRLWGVHLWSVRLVSLFSGAAIVFLVWRLTKRHWQWNTDQTISAIAALLLMPSFFYHVQCFRPEVQTAAFGFMSFYALLLVVFRLTSSAGKHWVMLCLAGAAAGAAMLTHLSGCMYAGAGALMLAKERRWMDALIFSCCAILVFAPYPIDVLLHYDLAVLQTSHSQAQAKFSFSFVTPFINLFNEQQRFFRKPQFIVVSVFAIALVASTWRNPSSPRQFLRWYFAALFLVLGVMLEDKRDYFALYAPWLALIIADALPDIFFQRRFVKIICACCAIVFIGYGLYFQGKDATYKESVSALNREITRTIPDGARCLAPLNVMYEEIGRLHCIAFSQAFATMDGDRPTITLGSLKHFCDIRKIEYVIMNRFGEERDVIADAETQAIALDSAFTTLRRTPDYWLLQRRHN